MDLNQFGTRMKELSVKAEAGINRKVRRIALSIFTELVVSTPVDTGRARSNWTVALGRAPDTINEEPFVPGKDGSTDAANANAAIKAATAALDDREPGQDIHIGNNVPYIEQLNEGSSAQAPAGFIQTAISNGIARMSPGRDKGIFE